MKKSSSWDDDKFTDSSEQYDKINEKNVHIFRPDKIQKSGYNYIGNVDSGLWDSCSKFAKELHLDIISVETISGLHGNSMSGLESLALYSNGNEEAVNSFIKKVKELIEAIAIEKLSVKVSAEDLISTCPRQIFKPFYPGEGFFYLGRVPYVPGIMNVLQNRYKIELCVMDSPSKWQDAVNGNKIQHDIHIKGSKSEVGAFTKDIRDWLISISREQSEKEETLTLIDIMIDTPREVAAMKYSDTVYRGFEYIGRIPVYIFEVIKQISTKHKLENVWSDPPEYYNKGIDNSLAEYDFYVKGNGSDVASFIKESRELFKSVREGEKPAIDDYKGESVHPDHIGEIGSLSSSSEMVEYIDIITGRSESLNKMQNSEQQSKHFYFCTIIPAESLSVYYSLSTNYGRYIRFVHPDTGGVYPSEGEPSGTTHWYLYSHNEFERKELLQYLMEAAIADLEEDLEVYGKTKQLTYYCGAKDKMARIKNCNVLIKTGSRIFYEGLGRGGERSSAEINIR